MSDFLNFENLEVNPICFMCKKENDLKDLHLSKGSLDGKGITGVVIFQYCNKCVNKADKFVHKIGKLLDVSKLGTILEKEEINIH